MPTDVRDCPFCGAEVKKSNFTRHLRKVHADLEGGEFEEKGLSKPAARKGAAAGAVVEEREDRRKAELKKGRARRETRLMILAVVVVLLVSSTGIYAYHTMTANTGGSGGNVPNGTGGGGGGGGGGSNPTAIIETSMGTIKMELYMDRAPTTAGNFKDLAKSGFFNGLIFHRVVPSFVIQGGGFKPDGSQVSASSIPWENTGYKNNKYTVAMARSGDANQASSSGTATSQFFINLKDNNSTLDSYAYPYVVFGAVTDGFSVVDAIGSLPTGTVNGMSDWPDNPPVITSVTIRE